MLEYFRDQIMDELDGAKNYIRLAMQSKGSHPAWAKMFVEMSSAELGHATNLYKMFNEEVDGLNKAYTVMPDEIATIVSDVTKHYAKCYAEVKYMHEAYNK